MEKIPLVGGGFALVDNDDFEELSKFKWHLYKAKKNNYARRIVWKKNRRHLVRMHRQILGESISGFQVDHKNGNGLDNRKENLRKCTNAENKRNCGKKSDNTSGFKGVSWHKKSGKWRAQIVVDGRSIHLGVFSCKILAAKSYDMAAQKHHGEFARPNFAEK